MDFIRDENNQNYLPNNLYGSFSFTGRYSGSAYADFLLGPSANNGTVQSGAKLVSSRYDVQPLRAGPVQGYTPPHFELWDPLGTTCRPIHDKFGRIFNYSPAAGALVVPDDGIQSHQSAFPERP